MTDADLDWSDRAVIKLELRDAVIYGQTVTVAYTAGTVTARDDSILETFGAKSVKNSVIKPPNAPAELKAWVGNGEVRLEWNAVAGATGYKVYQSSGGSYAQITEGLAGTSYTAVGLTNGTTYYFVVKASNAGGDSENSNQASATPVGP